MDAGLFILNQLAERHRHQAQREKGLEDVLAFYTMRRDMQVRAMQEARTAMQHREAEVAHQIYSGIVQDLQWALKLKTPAADGDQHGSL